MFAAIAAIPATGTAATAANMISEDKEMISQPEYEVWASKEKMRCAFVVASTADVGWFHRPSVPGTR